jgi:hypothetical protein
MLIANVSILPISKLEDPHSDPRVDDFALWRAARYRTSRRHVTQYYRVQDVQPAEVPDDQDDRQALYAL